MQRTSRTRTKPLNSSRVERKKKPKVRLQSTRQIRTDGFCHRVGARLYGGPAFAATLTVGTCQGSSPYSTIQEAVNAANAGDTVPVCPGTYAESVLIETNLTPIGIESRLHGGPVSLPTIIYPSSVDRLCLDGSSCPQIFVKNRSAVDIADLEVDGSNFKLDACSHDPIGILFQDCGGTVGGAISASHDSPCEEGYDHPGNTCVSVNAIDGFCAGIVNMYSSDTGNTYTFDAFSNDSVDIMPTPAGPRFELIYDF